MSDNRIESKASQGRDAGGGDLHDIEVPFLTHKFRGSRLTNGSDLGNKPMKQRRTVYLIVAVLALSIVVGGILALALLFYSHRYAEIVISDRIEIGPEWTELRLSKPLKVHKDIQFVSLEIVPPYSAWKGPGITTPEGQLVNPQIRIFGNDGFECDLTHSGATRVQGIIEGTEYAEYRCAGGLPKQEEIQRILIRSDVPIVAKRIVWAGSNRRSL